MKEQLKSRPPFTITLIVCISLEDFHLPCSSHISMTYFVCALQDLREYYENNYGVMGPLVRPELLPSRQILHERWFRPDNLHRYLVIGEAISLNEHEVCDQNIDT